MQRERGVAKPHVAVVPVPTAPERLRQARRGRRDDSPGLVVGQRAQHKQRAMHLHRVDAWGLRRRARRPSQPPFGGGGNVLRRRPPRGNGQVRREPGHREVDGLPVTHADPPTMPIVDRVQRWASADDPIGACDGDDGTRALFVALPHPGNRLAVVEADHQVLREFDCAADPANAPNDVGVSVADGHQVNDLRHACRCDPACDEREGAVDIGPGRLARLRTRRKLPAAVILGAEQGTEHRRRVETRETQPVDAAIAADERSGATITDQGIILDAKSHDAV